MHQLPCILLVSQSPAMVIPSSFPKPRLYWGISPDTDASWRSFCRTLQQASGSKRKKWKKWKTNLMILLMAEILHQLIGSLSHYLQGFIHAWWCRISSINSICTLLFCAALLLVKYFKRHLKPDVIQKKFAPLFSLKFGKWKTHRWWLNQPIWKYACQNGSFPQGFGMRINKLNPPPPGKRKKSNPYHPWDSYIYLHL